MVIAAEVISNELKAKNDDYTKLHELELNAAIKKSRDDVKNDRVHSDGIDEHIKRVTNTEKDKRPHEKI
jgi:hypothetical protein